MHVLANHVLEAQVYLLDLPEKPLIRPRHSRSSPLWEIVSFTNLLKNHRDLATIIQDLTNFPFFTITFEDDER